MRVDDIEILLVEDNPDDAEMTVLALRKAKVANEIQLVADGAEALEYVFGEGRYAGRPVEVQPRVVLLDLKLPLVGGLDVLRRLKSDERTRSLPVVVLTSSREERDIVESYDLGANSYIVKPVDFAGFTEAMQSIGLYWMLLNRPPHTGAD